MADYSKDEIKRIEEKWHNEWQKRGIYKVTEDTSKPKYYVLDMFPYPSGAGLHVGHPLGYIASDIVARFKRLKGFNVLHPMGFDAFGLPAEQYAIEHGVHPAKSTADNIQNFKNQLGKIGFCYDWSREVQTCDPKYYRWTQWIFLQIFDSWYNRKNNKAERITTLTWIFENEGNAEHPFPNSKYSLSNGESTFSPNEWKAFNQKQRQEVLMQYRLAYLAYTDVNWCEALGTVLANDEVVNGVSYRGGFPVVKKQMRQWSLRITEYAERLLGGLDEIDFSDSMKEIQRNWIGKSVGALIDFDITPGTPELIPALSPQENAVTDGHAQNPVFSTIARTWRALKDGPRDKPYPSKPEEKLRQANGAKKIEGKPGGEVLTVFTTRPDTIFGVDFMALAPEHELVKKITTAEHKEEVEKYLKYVESRSEIDRMAEVKKITGCFTGAYAINPFNKRRIEVWISEYVLAGYGTGAIMAVPCGDERDFKFAKHFNIPITNIIGSHFNGKEANPTKDAVLENSDFLNGMVMHEAIDVVINKLEEIKIGKRQVNYKMRDAGWSRQRYWGEPFPVVYHNDMPYPMNDNDLPLALPDLNNFKSPGTGEGPLANLTDWINFSENAKRDSNTMPTHAGAAWYFLRYMDPHNDKEFANKKALDYWSQVDVYIGGSEHAVAHLLYSRLWVKILHDLGYISFDEPFKKLINQGKITGDSRFVYRGFVTFLSFDEETGSDPKHHPSIYLSKGLCDKLQFEVPLKDKDIAIYNEAVNIIDEQLASINKKEQQKGNLTNGEFRISFDNVSQLHVDVNIVVGDVLDTEAFKKWKPDFANAEFILEEGKYICGSAIEKMSKSKYNVVNPDDIIDKYGADTLRLYEMFLGPLEQSKPWSTSGIDGVYKFLRRFWNLFHDNLGNWNVSEAEATKAELKALHKVIKKVEYDIDHYSFNTSVSEFMICANELSSLKCNKRAILEPLTIVLASYAPHITEELWEKLGHADSILNAKYPDFNEAYLKENDFEYPISINGKVRSKMNFTLDMPVADIEKIVLASEAVQKWSEGKAPKKVIIVPGKIVNIVL
jgi:leucyl-tRNA synthetase